jgi:hypothetical protein
MIVGIDPLWVLICGALRLPRDVFIHSQEGLLIA